MCSLKFQRSGNLSVSQQGCLIEKADELSVVFKALLVLVKALKWIVLVLLLLLQEFRRPLCTGYEVYEVHTL